MVTENYAMKLEVLCATMNQSDFSKLKQMNISSDVVFANQTDCYSYAECDFGIYKAKMISTPTCGVGRNRNIALLHASGDILLFADDDVHYNDDYREKVLEAYERFPKADMIIFSMDIVKNGEIIRRISNKNARLSYFSSLKYGTYVCSIRRSAQHKSNLWFSLLFGGGTNFAHGEDTIFITDAFKAGLKVYISDYCLGTCSKDDSTCFHGYDDKYFFDQGVLYRRLFGWMGVVPAIRFLIKKRKTFGNEFAFLSALKKMRAGMCFYNTADVEVVK